MKRWIHFFVTVSSVVLLSFLLIEGFIIKEGKKIENVEVDYVIVLGARLYGDMPSPALSERLIIAAQYLDSYPHVPVVVSGGQGPGEYVTEAFAMEEYLIDRGISQNRIIQENQSTNTFENLKFSLENIRQKDQREDLKVLIVSNDFHLFRAKMLARRLGVKPYGLPAKTPPSIVARSYVREYFAVIKSFLFDTE